MVPPGRGTPPTAAAAPWTAGRLAECLGAELRGDGERPLTGIAGLAEATPGDVSFLSNSRYRRLLAATHAGAVIVGPGEATPPGCVALVVPNPYAAFARVIPLFHPEPPHRPGIGPGAHVDPAAAVGPEASLAPGSYVGPGCLLGARVTLHPGVVLLEDVHAGDDVVLFPNVTVYPGTRIGSRVTVHANSVLGSDGFGYVQEENRHRKIPQVGRVVIEDDVEIGAAVTIDRATLGETRIGEGTKIDNLVQIAHNVRIGPRCILVAQVGIAGSTEIGAGTMIAGQSGVAGHLRIGAGVRIGAKSAVLQDVPDGAFVTGSPAMPHSVWLRWARIQERIPAILRRWKPETPARESGTGEEP